MPCEQLTQQELIKQLSLDVSLQGLLDARLFVGPERETPPLYGAISELAPSTAAHCKAVMHLVVKLDQNHSKTGPLNLLRDMALLHDIGKLPNVIRNIVEEQKPLANDNERELIKLHPIVSYCILFRRGFTRAVLDPILLHHVSYDKLTGYPLLNEDLPELVFTVGEQLGIRIDKSLVPTHLPDDPVQSYPLYLLTLADQAHAAIDRGRGWRTPVPIGDLPRIFDKLFGTQYADFLQDTFVRTISQLVEDNSLKQELGLFA